MSELSDLDRQIMAALRASEPEYQLPVLRGKLRRLQEISKLPPERLAVFVDFVTERLNRVERMLPVTDKNWQAATDHVREAVQAMRNAILEPYVVRDAKRQAGTRKPKRPDIDEWIEKQLRRDLKATATELYNRAPDWITDNMALESAFRRRVTKGRKKLKTAASK